MVSNQPTIIWDVDDVLNSLTQVWFETHWLREHPECSLRYEELVENPPHRLLQVPLGVYLDSLDRFRTTGPFARLEPVAEVLAWFEQHGEAFRHIALTATPLQSASHSAEWVMRLFGRWIRGFCLVPSAREGRPHPRFDLTKAEFITWWGKGDVFVDDNPGNIEAARALGLRTVLIPRPWNECRLTLAQSLQQLTG